MDFFLFSLDEDLEPQQTQESEEPQAVVLMPEEK